MRLPRLWMWQPFLVLRLAMENCSRKTIFVVEGYFMLNHLSMRLKSSISLLPICAFILLINTFVVTEADARQILGGEGSGVTSGYEIADQSYTLSQIDPTLVESVEFTLLGSQPAKFVVIRLASSGSWYSCTLDEKGGLIYALCDTTTGTSLYVSELDEFQVVSTR